MICLRFGILKHSSVIFNTPQHTEPPIEWEVDIFTAFFLLLGGGLSLMGWFQNHHPQPPPPLESSSRSNGCRVGSHREVRQRRRGNGFLLLTCVLHQWPGRLTTSGACAAGARRTSAGSHRPLPLPPWQTCMATFRSLPLSRGCQLAFGCSSLAIVYHSLSSRRLIVLPFICPPHLLCRTAPPQITA